MCEQRSQRAGMRLAARGRARRARVAAAYPPDCTRGCPRGPRTAVLPPPPPAPTRPLLAFATPRSMFKNLTPPRIVHAHAVNRPRAGGPHIPDAPLRTDGEPLWLVGWLAHALACRAGGRHRPGPEGGAQGGAAQRRPALTTAAPAPARPPHRHLARASYECKAARRGARQGRKARGRGRGARRGGEARAQGEGPRQGRKARGRGRGARRGGEAGAQGEGARQGTRCDDMERSLARSLSIAPPGGHTPPEVRPLPLVCPCPTLPSPRSQWLLARAALWRLPYPAGAFWLPTRALGYLGARGSRGRQPPAAGAQGAAGPYRRQSRQPHERRHQRQHARGPGAAPAGGGAVRYQHEGNSTCRRAPGAAHAAAAFPPPTCSARARCAPDEEGDAKEERQQLVAREEACGQGEPAAHQGKAHQASSASELQAAPPARPLPSTAPLPSPAHATGRPWQGEAAAAAEGARRAAVHG